MFFALSKILGFFTLPSNLLVMLGLVGLALTGTRLARIGRRLAAAALILFAVVGVSPFSKGLTLVRMPLRPRISARAAIEPTSR